MKQYTYMLALVVAMFALHPVHAQSDQTIMDTISYKHSLTFGINRLRNFRAYRPGTYEEVTTWAYLPFLQYETRLNSKTKVVAGISIDEYSDYNNPKRYNVILRTIGGVRYYLKHSPGLSFCIGGEAAYHFDGLRNGSRIRRSNLFGLGAAAQVEARLSNRVFFTSEISGAYGYRFYKNQGFADDNGETGWELMGGRFLSIGLQYRFKRK